MSTNRKAPTAKRQVAKVPAVTDQEQRLAERRARIQARASVLPVPEIAPVSRRVKDDDRIVDPDEMPSHSGDSMGWLTER